MVEGRLQSVTLQKLRIFAAVARERSFAKAAEATCLSSPTISDEVKSVETLIGMRLLHRSRGSSIVELTEAGEILLQSYNEISQTIERANEAFEAMKHLEIGTISFGTNVTFAHYVMPVICDNFHRVHPGIRLCVQVSQNHNILENLVRRKLDLAVLLDNQEVPGFTCESLGPCFMLLAGPFGHRLAGPSAAPFRELAQERLILGDRHTPARVTLERMAKVAGITLNVILEVSNGEISLQAALRSDDMTVVNVDSVTLAGPVASGRLCVLNIEGLPVKMEWFIVHLPGSLSPAAQAVKDYLLESKGIVECLPSVPGISPFDPHGGATGVAQAI